MTTSGVRNVALVGALWLAAATMPACRHGEPAQVVALPLAFETPLSYSGSDADFHHFRHPAGDTWEDLCVPRNALTLPDERGLEDPLPRSR